MEFKNVIEKNKFSLVVSLPSNDLGMAKAALEGGSLPEFRRFLEEKSGQKIQAIGG